MSMSSTQAKELVDRFHTYLETRVQLLDKLLEVTVKMVELIQQSKEEELESILSMRQRIMDKLDGLDKQYNEVKELFTQEAGIAILNTMPKDAKEDIVELEEHAQGLFQDAFRLNEVLRVKMGAAMQEVGKQLRQIRQGKLMNSAYETSAVTNEGFFFDNKK